MRGMSINALQRVEGVFVDDSPLLTTNSLVVTVEIHH